jgi:hypothetical protein
MLARAAFAAAAAALALASAAQAVSIGAGCASGCAPAAGVAVDGVGDAFSVQFDGSVERHATPGLTASASFLVTAFDGASGHVVLQITLTNTSDAALFDGARVSALGFDVDAALTGAASGGLFDHAVRGSSFPNGFGPVDVCAISNPNNCSGGRNAGLQIGQSGVFTLTLDFGGPLASLQLTNFGVRYQSIDPVGRFVDDSGTGCGQPVPEPRALALAGAAGLALLGRKRRPTA